MGGSIYYDLIIIGGGISSCVFASSYIKNGFKGKIAILEAGRKLGGRASTRNSLINKGWELNHGSPNFNITNKSNNLLLESFINDLLKEKVIQRDSSEFIEISSSKKLNSEANLDFYSGEKFIPRTNMTKLSEDIISLNNSRNQIDFYFEELILNLNFTKTNKWTLYSNQGITYQANFIVFSSNLLLHKRSLEIFNTNQIPIRKAIPLNFNKKVDLVINTLERQEYIQRLTFLIYTKANYFYKDNYLEKYRHFILNDYLAEKYKFERVIFQKQKNNQLGIVLHTKNTGLISEFLKCKNECKYKENLLSIFNQLFDGSPFINQLKEYQDISIMRWRASQPKGTKVHEILQFCEEQNLGFCGDWFSFEGFGRVEGAISSALSLAAKISSFS